MNSNNEPLIPENNINNDTFKEPSWTWKPEHEKILIEWADKAMCYRWLHAKSHQKYSSTNAWYTIPVIIMSTLTGTANFAQDRFPEHIKPFAQMGIGAVNIFAGILTTIAQFLKISELNEAHRVASISWDKFYRNIKVELGKSREERMNIGHMLKIYKEEYDRLMETSPSINEPIIKLFNDKFPVNNIKETEEKIRPDIKRPEICDELISTSDILYKTETKITKTKTSIIEIVNQKKQNLLSKYETEVRDWSKKFKDKYSRNPLKEELYSNLQDTMNPDILKQIIDKLMDEFEHINEEHDPSNNV